jgi:CDGSH-type Zn-finger protein/uncharacterized Fe-S cluster protein YjdI
MSFAVEEPKISVRSREELLFLLAEAAEIEHNLMCCYLFAAFGLKTEADGLSAADAKEIAGWKRAIVGVAVEEMTHLALVANLTSAIGGTPHFSRPNFPIARGYHPSGVVVQLRRFDRATLDHFIFLERPEGVDLADPTEFASNTDPSFVRRVTSRRFMPSAQDYLTVGHLYRSIREGVESLAEKLGAASLFNGDPALQVGADLATLPGLMKVTDLASALAALDVIVEQGEGSSADVEHSHYRRFTKIRDAYEQRLSRDPAFDPSQPVAPSPVMRHGPDLTGKTFIDHPQAADVMELANAIYAAMLRALAQGFAETDAARKRKFLDAAIDGMFALGPVAEHLTTLPATNAATGQTAGMSFATLRDLAAFPVSAPAENIFAERLRDLADGAAQVLPTTGLAKAVSESLRGIASKLAGDEKPEQKSEFDTADGKYLAISFETKRCIHARFCVLQQPGVFKANVVGPWLSPDDATSVEALVSVAQNCPSGAITYQRKDGGANEAPPAVNLVQVRENGPLAFRGELVIEGAAKGFRATLCRCGQSKNKPYCDGSHVEAGFAATGEPSKGDVTALSKRDGPVGVRPQKNGPLLVNGNMEFISGTGRTFRKTESAMLCRCGASANKPFCDGSHARVGFKS